MNARRLLRRIALAGAAVLVAVVLAGCHGAGTLPAGEAYLTIENQNSGTSNQYVYKNVTIDSKVQSPSEISENSQQRYVVSTSSTHSVEFQYVTPTATNPIGPFQVNVSSSGCLVVGPTGNSTTYTKGC